MSEWARKAVKLFTKAVGWAEGVRRLVQRKLLPTTLGTRELASVSADLKRVSVFSAKIEVADALQGINDTVREVIRGIEKADEETFQFVTADGTVEERRKKPLQLSIADAKVQIRDKFESLGIRAEDTSKIGTIQDPQSDQRLSLIVETQESLAYNHGSYLSGQDEDILAIWPAQELIRVSPSTVRRDWKDRWERAGGALYEGRMVAMKDSIVWRNLGNSMLFADALGNPYPPFAFNSGMGVEDVDREEALRLGVMTPATPDPEPDRRLLSEDTQASAKRFDEALRITLASDPALAMDGDTLTLR